MDVEEAKSRLRRILERFDGKADRFCEWLEECFTEGLTFFQYPKEHWKKIRTVKVVERLNQEQKRRTRVVSLFPSVESCERLVVTLSMRIHEEWVTGRRYLKDE